ncbi:amino acid ABC transporter substrate-binding protein [Herbaspirillum sp. GCM10030257]|uniref:amino acid ABC transporter substrate-binding protein n=1 Tax=Herbaspirillum sp. GCM10030257 TaxID=3273393 RepID=UPI00360914CE
MLKPTINIIASVVVLTISAIAPSMAGAQTADQVLNRIKETKTVTIGYRESSIPFSFLDANQKPVGYSLDICAAVVENLKKTIGLPNLTVKMQAVDLSTRIPLIQNGTIDMECGSTVNTLARQKQVDFSYVTAVAADQILVKAASPVKEIEDLAGKAVALPTGSTSARLVQALNNKKQLGMRFLFVKDQAEGFLAVDTGRAEGYITDNVILYGLRKRAKQSNEFRVTGRPLSYLPYGIMVAKNNSTLLAVINQTIAEKAHSGEAIAMYDKWFDQLKMPLDPRAQVAFELNAIPE